MNLLRTYMYRALPGNLPELLRESAFGASRPANLSDNVERSVRVVGSATCTSVYNRVHLGHSQCESLRVPRT